MKYKDYLIKRDLSFTEAAEEIGVTPETSRRYANGERIPEPQIMKRIVSWSHEEVTANDFYA